MSTTPNDMNKVLDAIVSRRFVGTYQDLNTFTEELDVKKLAQYLVDLEERLSKSSK